MLHCGICLASQRDLDICSALISKQFGGSSGENLATPEHPVITLAPHRIDKSKLNFDFNIVTASSSISSRLNHVDDLNERACVLAHVDIYSNPHASVEEKAYAKEVEECHDMMIHRLRKETTGYDNASASYFSGEGGDFIHLKLPRKLHFSLIGGRNWSVATLAHTCSAMLCAQGIVDEVETRAMPKDHTHGSFHQLQLQREWAMSRDCEKCFTPNSNSASDGRCYVCDYAPPARSSVVGMRGVWWGGGGR
jgi:hypothetical protein